MIKILQKTFFVLLFLSFTVQSQNYIFSKFNSTYTDLTSNTVISPSGWDDFTIIDRKMPFPIQFFGQPQDSLYIMGGFAAFKQLGAGNFPGPQIYFFDAMLVEHASLANSNISILVSGSAPNRIYKVQTKNAGYSNDGGSTESANVQLWLFESTNVIEIHFGLCNGSTGTYSPLSGPTVGIFNSTSLFMSLSGSAANPVASTSIASLGVTGNPATNQVYRFTPTSVGIYENENNSFGSIFPNPSVGEINLLPNENLNNATLTISNICGQILFEQSNITLNKNQSFKVETDLTNGVYFVKVLSENKQYTKRLVINK